MGGRTARRLLRDEGGFLTLQHTAAAALAMVFFAALANLIVMQYALGVVTAALDEGARQGARSADPVAACLDRMESTLGAIVGGAIDTGTRRSCVVDNGWVVARAEGTLVAWAPIVPSWSFVREARAPLEEVT